MTKANEYIIDVSQSTIMDEDKLKHVGEAYEVPESLSIKDMTICLEQRKIMQLTKEPIRLIDLFTGLDRRLMRLTEQQSIKWIFPLRPSIQTQLDVFVHPNLNTKLYHGFKGYKIFEWKVCNRVWKEKKRG